jgi:hypothetical protein
MNGEMLMLSVITSRIFGLLPEGTLTLHRVFVGPTKLYLKKYIR